MDGTQQYCHLGQAMANQTPSPSETIHMPSISPQLTGSLFFPFPPPPRIPPPSDPQHLATNMILQQSSTQTSNAVLSTVPEYEMALSKSDQNDKGSVIDEGLSNGLSKNAFPPMNVEYIPRSVSGSDYAGPYSLLFPGSLVHHIGGSGSAPIYHQFSPVVPVSLPQVHPMYPVNVLPAKDPVCTNPAFVPAQQVMALPERSMQTMHPTSSGTAPPCIPQIPESPWSTQSATMTSNPPLYWGHYVASDQGQAVAFAPQQFMRRHSIVENSSVVTPTNVCPPCNIAGIVSATPEFIHPRQPDVPQWLMSPPVGEQDPSIISYAPMLYHNVRGVSSLSGIAIPVLGPMGPSVSFSNALHNVPAPSVESPTVVISPVTYLDNPPSSALHPTIAELQSKNREAPGVFSSPGISKDKITAIPDTAVVEHYYLLTPGDFVTSSFCAKTAESPGKGLLLSPNDFDSGYDSSICRSEQTPASSELTEGMCSSLHGVQNGCPPNGISVKRNVFENEKECGVDKAAMPNYGETLLKSQACSEHEKSSLKIRARFERGNSSLNSQMNSLPASSVKEMPKQKCTSKVVPTDLKRPSQKQYQIQTSESSYEIFGKRDLQLDSTRTKYVLEKDETVKQPRKKSSCPKHHRHSEALLYANLFSALVNLSAASSTLCKKLRLQPTKCYYRHKMLHKFPFTGTCVEAPCTSFCVRKHLQELQRPNPCWQCTTKVDSNTDAKQPAPDVFNCWPNIPPPPAHSTKEDDCQSMCGAAQICNDALPLAAALFHNEITDCCQAGRQNDEPQIPPDYPIGVFWDIENCAVPTGKSPLGIVQRIRERFFSGHKEAEFMCVCDINKESRPVIQELNIAQVNVVHINAIAKNAADDKLRQSMRRFAHNHPAPATLVLITGDSNFTSEVSDLRHRHKYFVVLIHPSHANAALKQAANTVICYEELVADLPIVHFSPKNQLDPSQSLLLVSNLPLNSDANAVRARLRQLSDNCGGKVVKLSMGTAVLRFATSEVANRALKRIQGEDVFGHSIKLSILKQSPERNGKNFYHSPKYSPTGNTNASSGFRQRQPAVQSCGLQPNQQSITPVQAIPTTCGQLFQRYPFPNAPPPIMVPPPRPFAILPRLPPYIPTTDPSPFEVSHNAYKLVPVLLQAEASPLSARSPEDQQERGVKLTVSNIDAQLGVASIQETLQKQVSTCCQVLDMKVRPHNRFTVVCDVTVPCVEDASRVLQNLQRQRIGTKRVLVTLAHQNADELSLEDTARLKRDCFAILRDCPGKRLPLYRFFALYEKRFQQKIKLDELRRISDIALLCDIPAGLEVYINPKISDEQSLEQHIASFPRSARSTPDINHDFLLPVCKLHYPADSQRFAPSEKASGWLKIELGLREFSAKLHALLHSHHGILQLDGFEYCYCAEYGTFPFPSNKEEGGVIVEHQASYVPGVQIITSQPHCLGVKAIVWAQPQSDTGSDTASDTSGASRWKSPNLIHFSREVVDLLKERPYCCLLYADFASAYQLHFGHACRPSDSGFTRLSDLLTAIPHVLQIMGSLSNRILTLTHRAQVKRFTLEVVKILKSTPDRAILVAQMPELYNRTFNRVWRLRDYGVSVLSDLLDDIPEGHICATGEGDNIVLSLPMKERTSEEKERTQQFVREVVKILRTRPHYWMPFTDFVPAYHRHFGRQCKLANYGFAKLIDLFEALPHVVQVLEKGTEKHLALTGVEKQKILSIQITSILRAQIPPSMPPLSGHVADAAWENDADGPALPLACIPALFQQKYGFPLVPQDLEASSVRHMISKLSHAVKVIVNNSGDEMICLAKRKPLRLLSAQLLAVLLDQSADQLDVEQLHTMYIERFKDTIEPHDYGFLSFSDIIRKALPGVVKMDLDAPECLIHLKPLYKEARAIRSVLLKNNGVMTMGEFNFAYLTTFHRPMDCEKLGFPTFESLLRSLPNVLIVKGFGTKRTLTLRNHMQLGPLTTATSLCHGKNGNGVIASTSMDDIQALEASPRTHPSVWMPKVPPCMMPFWTSQRLPSGHLASSANTGNFRSRNEKRDKVLQAIERPALNFMPPNSSTVSCLTAQTHRFSKARTPQAKSPLLKFVSLENSAPTSVTCTFAVGQISNASLRDKEKHFPPVRRSAGNSVITLPSGSTSIASTSSCSTSSTPKSVRSSDSNDRYSDETCSTFSSSENQQTPVVENYSRFKANGVSSLPNSPFASKTAASIVGSLPSMDARHPASDHGSPGRIQLAASFSTLTRS